MPKPGYKRLHDDRLHARLVKIRETVTPILASNLLRQFTDHSVSHSDRVCELIDQLTAPMSDHALNDTEAFILYASAYLHDVGMQHERCDETRVMARALAVPPYRGRRWADLDEKTRCDLLRRHHHEISGEMVKSCFKATRPVLGIQLTEEDYPGYVGSVCEAHAVPPDADRYRELTAEGPGIRTSLLPALLRLADILDESRPRTQMYRELTVQLDVESQMHWWRHYYVSGVTFRPEAKCITIWFQFPPDRREEYRPVVPELQRYCIEAELLAHRGVLLANGVGWHLEITEDKAAHAAAKPMPDEVFLRMREEVQHRRQTQETIDRLAALRQLEEAQGVVLRQLQAIKASGATASDKLRQAETLAEQLRRMGGQHEASIIFREMYDLVQKELGSDDSIEYGRRLGEMLLGEHRERLAGQVLYGVKPAAEALAVGDPRRSRFMAVWCRALLANADVAQAEQVLAGLRSAGLPSDELDELEAELAEAVLISGRAFQETAGPAEGASRRGSL